MNLSRVEIMLRRRFERPAVPRRALGPSLSDDVECGHAARGRPAIERRAPSRRYEVLERQVASLVVARIIAHRDAGELRIADQVVDIGRILTCIDHPEQIVVELVLDGVEAGAHVSVIDVQDDVVVHLEIPDVVAHCQTRRSDLPGSFPR